MKHICAECGNPDPKLQSLYTRECYCSGYCLAEGQLKYVRWVIRMNAEAANVG